MAKSAAFGPEIVAELKLTIVVPVLVKKTLFAVEKELEGERAAINAN